MAATKFEPTRIVWQATAGEAAVVCYDAEQTWALDTGTNPAGAFREADTELTDFLPAMGWKRVLLFHIDPDGKTTVTTLTISGNNIAHVNPAFST